MAIILARGDEARRIRSSMLSIAKHQVQRLDWATGDPSIKRNKQRKNPEP